MELFGTPTSPYVRRVRIVAKELGFSCDLIDTRDAAGQATLRRLNPLWRVPTARFDGQTVLDSATILERMLTQTGIQLPPAAGCARWEASNLLRAIDGAQDTAINIFYLEKDGAKRKHLAYLEKQASRLSNVMDHLDQAPHDEDPSAPLPSLAAVALFTMLDWMNFRRAYDVGAHARLRAFHKMWADRPSFAATRLVG